MQSVLHTKGQGGEISFLFHHHRQEAHIEDRGSTPDTKVNLEAGDALGGAKWTRRRHALGREKHTWRSTLGEAHLEDAGAMRT